LVTSKGLGSNKLGLVENPANLYWRTARAYQLEEFARQVAKLFDASRVGLFGEVYGSGVQDLTYGANAASERPGYALIDICIESAGQVRWLSLDEADKAVFDSSLEIPRVPVLYQGPFDLAVILPLADGEETVSGKQSHMREGVVVRPLTERYSSIVGGRAIAKIVSDGYLTRQGGTEYE
jgi:RNA ligase (TIGR02306 family)